MDKTGFISISERDDVIKALERAREFKGEVWQTDFSGRRVLFDIVDYTINLDENKIDFKLSGTDALLMTSELYIRISYRNIIFKLGPQDFKKNSSFEFTSKLPSIVLALKMRATDRYVLPMETPISLSIKRLSRSDTDLVTPLEVRIVDVSVGGFGIQISSANAEYFRALDHFWITAIDQKNLPREIFGIVLYVRPCAGKKTRKDVRIGLKLTQPLDWIILERLRAMSLKTLTA